MPVSWTDVSQKTDVTLPQSHDQEGRGKPIQPFTPCAQKFELSGWFWLNPGGQTGGQGQKKAVGGQEGRWAFSHQLDDSQALVA